MEDFEVTEKIFEQFRTVSDENGTALYCLFDVVQLLIGDDDISDEWEAIIAGDSYLYGLPWILRPVKDWVFDYFTDLECVERREVLRVIQYMPTHKALMLRLWLAERDSPFPYSRYEIPNEEIIDLFGLDCDQPATIRHYNEGVASIRNSCRRGGLTFEETVRWLNEFHKGLFAGRAAYQPPSPRQVRSKQAVEQSRTNIEIALLSVGMAVIQEESSLTPPQSFDEHLAMARKGAHAVARLYENYRLMLDRPL